MEIIRRGYIEPFSIEGPDAGTCSHYCIIFGCSYDCFMDMDLFNV